MDHANSKLPPKYHFKNHLDLCQAIGARQGFIWSAGNAERSVCHKSLQSVQRA